MTLAPRESSPLPADLSEAAFQRTVVDLAQWRGWRVFHVHDSRRSAAGWPDLAMLRGDRMLAVELKTKTGRVTDAQRGWLAALSCVPGVESFVWRPADWPAVQAVLR